MRIVAAGVNAPPPREDARFVTVVLQRDGGSTPADCRAQAADAWRAYARVAGVADEQLAGTQFIVDRDGWLRALGRRGGNGWSEDSLLCRSDTPAAAARAGADGLSALIARMDADPVRIGRLGLAHAR